MIITPQEADGEVLMGAVETGGGRERLVRRGWRTTWLREAT